MNFVLSIPTRTARWCVDRNMGFLNHGTAPDLDTRFVLKTVVVLGDDVGGKTAPGVYQSSLVYVN